MFLCAIRFLFNTGLGLYCKGIVELKTIGVGASVLVKHRSDSGNQKQCRAIDFYGKYIGPFVTGYATSCRASLPPHTEGGTEMKLQRSLSMLILLGCTLALTGFTASNSMAASSGLSCAEAGP